MSYTITELDRTKTELPEAVQAHIGQVATRLGAELNARLAVANGAHEGDLFVAVVDDSGVLKRYATATHPMARHADEVYLDGRWMVAL